MTIDRRSFLQGLGTGAVGVLAGCTAPAARSTTTPASSVAPAAWPDFDAADPGSFWSAVRAEYELNERPIYLNSGGLGPAPRPVLAKFDEIARGLQRGVATGHAHFGSSRKVMAAFFGVEEKEVCFVRNATEGNSIIAAGLDLRRGDEVIFETHAHPGGSLPWLNRAKQDGVVVKVFEADPTSAEGNLERITALVTPRTRVIQVSHITAPTGIVLPVAAISAFARQRGIWFHVDGAQSAGMVPVDLRAIDCDSYATSGHKWLGATHETGLLYIRADRIDDIAPRHVGAYSSEDFDFEGKLVYAEGVVRHEYGTRNAAAAAGMAEAVRFQERVGRDRIATYGADLASRLHAGLSAIPGVTVLTPSLPALRASMVTFEIEGHEAVKLFSYLLGQHGLRCRPVTEVGLQAIRVSTHIFNQSSDVDQVVAAVRAFPRSG
jgi:selenocysteine lyase/cysteine desulfurase